MPLCSNSAQSLWTSTLWCNVPGTLLDTWEAKLHPPFQSVQLWLPENRQQNMERSCKLTHHHWWKQLRLQNLYKENHHSIILFPDVLIQTLLLSNCCSCPLCPRPVALALSPICHLLCSHWHNHTSKPQPLASLLQLPSAPETPSPIHNGRENVLCVWACMDTLGEQYNSAGL